MIFKLRHMVEVSGSKLGRREASFPRYKTGTEEWKMPPYVILESGKSKVFLRTSSQQSGTGDEVFVAPSVFKDVTDRTEIKCSAVSAFRYRLDLVLHDPKQRAALCGTLLALIGVFIDGGLAVGKIMERPLWTVKDSTIIWSMFISMLLKVAGLCILLWKGILEDK